MKKTIFEGFTSLILLGVFLCSVTFVSGADWPCWRGANKNGLSSETGLLRNWTEEAQPKLVWQNPSVGQSMNGIAVVGNLVYTIGMKGGTECVFLIDNQTGKTIKTVPIGKSFGKKGKFPVQRSTPTFYKDKLYAVSSGGNLVCMNAGDLATLWTRNMITTMGGVLPPCGYCESPCVDGKWAIVCPGGPNASMVAVDRHWAANAWVARTGLPAGFSSIIKASFGREHQYVTYSGGGLFGVKVRGKGQVRWRYEAVAHESGFNTVAPLWFGQTMLATGPLGTACVWIQKDGDAFKTEEVWFREDLKISAGDMLRVNDCVFACNDEDGLVCFSYKTGDKKWSNKSIFPSASEEEVDEQAVPRKKKPAKRDLSSSEAIPESVSINSPILAQLMGAPMLPGMQPPVSIGPAGKASGKKKKKVAPPEAPKCIGTMAYAEGLIYLRTSEGELLLIEASPEKCIIRGRLENPKIKPGMGVTPVIANGFLYLREGGTIFCYDIRNNERKEGTDGAGGDGKNGGGEGNKPLPGMQGTPTAPKRGVPKLG